MDIKTLETIIKESAEKDKSKVNMHNRYIRKPATKICNAFSENPFSQDPYDADGIPILSSTKVSKSDPNIKCAYDNVALIADQKSGYFANIKRVISDKEPKFKELTELYSDFDYNNFIKTVYSKMATKCALLGNTYLLNFVSNNNIGIKIINAWSAKIIYNPMTGVSEYGVVYEYGSNNTSLNIWVYDKLYVERYYGEDISKIKFVNRNLHGFTEVPLVEFENNDESIGNSQKAVTLIDAYDGLVSDGVTEFASLRMAYLFMKNMGTIDEKTVERVKKTGVFAGEVDSDVKFITKQIDSEYTRLMSDILWNGIFIAGSSIDPKAIQQLKDARVAQIKNMFFLMETDAMKTENSWSKSLRIEDGVIKSFWTKIGNKITDYDSKNISYEFVRNYPTDIIADLEGFSRAGGKLPNRVLMLKSGLAEDDAQAEEWASEAEDEENSAMPNLEDNTTDDSTDTTE